MPSSPTSSPSSCSSWPESPKIIKREEERGRLYQAYTDHGSSISDKQFNHQTKRFHKKAIGLYSTEYSSTRQASYAPNAAAGQVHQGRELFLSTSERVNAAGGGRGMNWTNEAYNNAVRDSPYENHRSNNKCAEGGTTGMIQVKYGADINMQGKGYCAHRNLVEIKS